MPNLRKGGDCLIEAHSLIAQIDEKLNARVLPIDVWRFVNNTTPDDQVSLSHMETHARRHLKVKPKDMRRMVPAPEPERPPSEKLGRAITEADIEQRLMRRYYDSIDSIPPEKIAELMIEREKAKARAAALPKPATPKTPSEEEVPADVAEMRAAANAALGPKRGRTGLRAVR